MGDIKKISSFPGGHSNPSYLVESEFRKYWQDYYFEKLEEARDKNRNLSDQLIELQFQKDLLDEKLTEDLLNNLLTD